MAEHEVTDEIPAIKQKVVGACGRAKSEVHTARLAISTPDVSFSPQGEQLLEVHKRLVVITSELEAIIKELR